MTLGDALNYAVIVLCLVVIISAAAMVVRRGRQVTSALRPYQPKSPIQVLERRLAAGEISAEQYQYERYLLEKEGS